MNRTASRLLSISHTQSLYTCLIVLVGCTYRRSGNLSWKNFNNRLQWQKFNRQNVFFDINGVSLYSRVVIAMKIKPGENLTDDIFYCRKILDLQYIGYPLAFLYFIFATEEDLQIKTVWVKGCFCATIKTVSRIYFLVYVWCDDCEHVIFLHMSDGEICDMFTAIFSLNEFFLLV